MIGPDCVRGVVTSGKILFSTPTGVIQDLVGTERCGAEEAADEGADGDGESRFFAHFALYRRMVGLAGLDPATR